MWKRSDCSMGAFICICSILVNDFRSFVLQGLFGQKFERVYFEFTVKNCIIVLLVYPNHSGFDPCYSCIKGYKFCILGIIKRWFQSKITEKSSEQSSKILLPIFKVPYIDITIDCKPGSADFCKKSHCDICLDIWESVKVSNQSITPECGLITISD